MLRLRTDAPAVAVHGAVLKADDFSAALAARDLVALAETAAARIREEAAVAYAEAKARGHREGLELGKAEMAERVVATMDQSSRYYTQVETALVEVVMKAVRRVLGEYDERERIIRIVHQALALQRSQSQVRLKVSPARTEWLQTRVAGLLAAFPHLDFVDVLADARLPADGCILETELGVIDATVETQLRAIEKALVQAIR